MTTHVLTPPPSGRMRRRVPVYQTTNPFVPIAEEHVLSAATLERAVLTMPAKAALRRLCVPIPRSRWMDFDCPATAPSALGDLQGAGRLASDAHAGIWFVGSYASAGIPLLEGSVRSLTLCAVPPRCVKVLVGKDNTDVLKRVSIFQHGLSRLVLSGVVLSQDFFHLLEELPHLRYLNLRQCVVAPPPETLHAPPAIEHLSLVHLVPQADVAVKYSPYFIHLFPRAATLSLDRNYLPPEGTYATPTTLVVPGTENVLYNSELYMHMLTKTNIRLHKLTHLIILMSQSYFPPFYVEPPVSVSFPPGQLQRLHSVTAPLQIVLPLLAAGTRLRRLAVQGALAEPELAVQVVDAVTQKMHPLSSLAFTLVHWDEHLLAHISAKLKELEALEVLYHARQLNQAFLKALETQYLPAMPCLKSLYIHFFPNGFYDPFLRRQIPTRTRSIPRAVGLTQLSQLTRFSYSLVRLRLDSDDTWSRANAASAWGTVKGTPEMDMQWTSSRSIDEDQRLDYDPSLYLRPFQYIPVTLPSAYG
ncbi:F-box domain-containing protein [Mycena kentingensis (nom. inval.)]|nr:F-box domain-containing protein [Mycena kentingensis (nom. inval.)]